MPGDSRVCRERTFVCRLLPPSGSTVWGLGLFRSLAVSVCQSVWLFLVTIYFLWAAMW